MIATARTYWRIPYFRRALVLLFAGAVAAVLVHAYLYLPARAAHDASLDEMQKLSLTRAELDMRRGLAGRVATLEAHVDTLDSRLLAGTDRSSIIERFPMLAAAAGVRIVHGSNSFGRERLGVTPISHELTVEGDYEAVRRFLLAARELETLTMLVAADISANNDGTLVRAQLEFVTFSEAGA